MASGHTKKEFISALKQWALQPDQSKTISKPLKQYLVWFFSQEQITERFAISFLHGVPDLLIEAMELFRTSEDEPIRAWRKKHLAPLANEGVPSLVDIEFGGLDRHMFVDGLCRELGKLFDEPWFEIKLRGLLQAQDYVLAQAMALFGLRVHQRGLFECYAKSKMRGMSGQFGNTTLRLWASAGRIMLTFAQPREGSEIEHSISFIGEDGVKKTGFGIQSCYTDVVRALTMINEVVANWPSTKAEQRRLMKPDREVTLDVIAASRASKE